MLRAVVTIALIWMAASLRADDNETFFEQSIRPLLAEHCWSCHGPQKQWNNLRLDSGEATLKGGDSGKVLVPGSPSQSLLIQAVGYGETLQMPPDYQLKPEQVDLLRRWIEMGATWPKSEKLASENWKQHWAFQPIKTSSPAEVESTDWCRNTIDQFILEKLKAKGLKPSPEADRETLIRRATYSVTGLPATRQQIDAFVNDARPDAYERLVDSLLESPRYGEHLGRMWLDVARYSDTKGYVYAREERFFVNSALYRDWVINAFNNDLPYDRFVQLQLAADQLVPSEPRDLAAMGLLTLGRRFLGVTHDIIDDRIDVIGRGLMGLTVSCARCHDHKYDPIPTADYYSLYGVFQCSNDRQVDLTTYADKQPSAEFQAELQKRQKSLSDKMSASRIEAGNRVRARIADYLWSQTELHKYGQEGFDVVLATTDIIPAFVRRWEGYLAQCNPESHPVFAPWRTWQSSQASELTREQIESLMGGCRQQSTLQPRVAALLEDCPQDLKQLADRYSELLTQVDKQYLELQKIERPAWTLEQQEWVRQNQTLIDVLYGAQAPCEVPDEEVISTETFFDSTTCVELWKLQGEVDRWRLKSESAPPVAVASFDRATLVEPRVFRRGNPANKGDYVTRHFLSLFSESAPTPFTVGSGRLELAKKIVDPSNPLTARVWVNRLWQHHIGQALVTTPSDFGLRAQPPSHPELLDWLADQLIRNGWSSKAIQRQILLSATFRQSSHPPGSEVHEFMQLDPDNRLLWRMNSRKLKFEELRDSLLVASDDLDLRPGGKARELFGKDDSNHRRTVYGLIDRQYLPPTLRVFDFANPDLHVGRRSETQVPQQSLYFLNSPFLAARAKSIIAKTSSRLKVDASAVEPASLSPLIKAIYQGTLQRRPTDSELTAAIAFMRLPDVRSDSQPTKQSFAWSYGYGEFDATQGKLKSFVAIPHFTGNAWQGGAALPDGKLGWVQLTAAGGHPGNDQKHACVRRWTANKTMNISISSTLKHEPNVSDGIRARIVSSRTGVMAESQIKAAEKELNVEPIEVQAGETIDFVVDILDELSHDQFLWAPRIQQQGPLQASSKSGVPASETQPTSEKLTRDLENWDAQRDFFGPATEPLSRLEQFAQVLLLTNEFAFVD